MMLLITSSGTSERNYDQFKVLTNAQNAVRFIVKNASTEYGQSIYLVGNCLELGNWDVNKAIGPFYNSTETIAAYPDLFFDVSVPKGYNLEYKFIKKDATGNVVWESGANHKFTVPTDTPTRCQFTSINDILIGFIPFQGRDKYLNCEYVPDFISAPSGCFPEAQTREKWM